jgi:mannose-1-phosphate guanylyltransferase/mannose-6-phosphate isomerase
MIYPILLCGGTGTRLWPLSRETYPKQFVRIIGEDSLFQQAARRMSGKQFFPPTVVTNTEFRFIVTEQLNQTAIDPGSILIEPEQKNTAPGILAAALHILKKDSDGIILSAPADHLIPDIEEFEKTVLRGVESAALDQIITFGIKINRPETG